MVETLEHLIGQAADFPRHSRSSLYKELMHSETFILNVGDPISQTRVTRVTRADETFAIWADKDPELGGIWVPVFAARDAVSQYVESRGLKAPEGKEFLWMEHGPGQVFSLLRGVDCFAGLTLFLDAHRTVSIPWSDVKALSEGHVPPDQPEVYSLPLETLTIPAGTRLAFGRAETGEAKGRLLCLPAAGHFKADDLRKLVRLDLGASGSAWTPCRHFLQILRYLKCSSATDAESYFQDVLNSLFAFEMFGEAEAFCGWLEEKGREAFAWPVLSAVYARTGKLGDLVELCRRAAARFPAEPAYPIHEVRALFSLGRRPEARRALTAALARFPQDPHLLKLGQDLPPAQA